MRYNLTTPQTRAIARKQFEEFWGEHPEAEKLKQFLADLIDRHRQRWAEGDDWSEQARARVEALEDLMNLNFDRDIVTLYVSPDELDDDEKAMIDDKRDSDQD